MTAVDSAGARSQLDVSWLQTIAAMHASGRQAVPQELPSQIDVITRSGQRFAERAEYPKGARAQPDDGRRRRGKASGIGAVLDLLALRR